MHMVFAAAVATDTQTIRQTKTRYTALHYTQTHTHTVTQASTLGLYDDGKINIST